MSVRYFSSERTIQAAGAAFACVDDDLSTKIDSDHLDRRGALVLFAAVLVFAFLMF